MKKVMMFCLGALMVACPSACVNDPTDSDAVCVEVEDATSACDESTEDVDTETETVVE